MSFRTTREALHRLVDELSDAEIERWRASAPDHGLTPPTEPTPPGGHDVVEARQYPVLAAIWDNDADRVFDDMEPGRVFPRQAGPARC